MTTSNALHIYRTLYFDDKGGENSPSQVHERVAKAVAASPHGPAEDITAEEIATTWHRLMDADMFRPNTPAMINLGIKASPITSACFVGHIEDDMLSIVEFYRDAALVFKGGAGMGINWGALREEGAPLSGGGQSSGPISFMNPEEAVGEAVRSGGKRRAAMMGMLQDSHPDIFKFIRLKTLDPNPLPFMNLSVAASDKFMSAVQEDLPWSLISPLTGEEVGATSARTLYAAIMDCAHKVGDPGLFFIDRANADCTIPGFSYKATNPCGEQPLLPRQSCLLASINLMKCVRPAQERKGPAFAQMFDFDKFRTVVETCVDFLDMMIDVSAYPTPAYKEMALNTRPIGLGIMGFADLLAELGIPYDSDLALEVADSVSWVLTRQAIIHSNKRAVKHGPYPWYSVDAVRKVIERFFPEDDEDLLEEILATGLRNSQWTTIAPTGSISIAANCSSGMEPLFALTWDKVLADGGTLSFVHPGFERAFEEESWYGVALDYAREHKGSIAGADFIPKKVREAFKVAHDIAWRNRIKVQAALQDHISSAISSTINLPTDTPPETIGEIYMAAWTAGLKGVTVYRDGARAAQPVQFGKMADPSPATAAAPLTRPKRRSGYTHEVTTGHGRIYLTVNVNDNGEVIEIFTNGGGKNGSVNSANLEAIARLVSIALQGGVSVERLAKTIRGINDGTCVWDRLEADDPKPAKIVSIPDAIGQVLSRFYETEPREQIETLQETTPLTCPSCHGPAVMKEGCLFCPTCGSRCS